MNYHNDLPQMVELGFEWTWNHQEPKELHKTKGKNKKNIYTYDDRNKRGLQTA
jgi:hypothetical protein